MYCLPVVASFTVLFVNVLNCEAHLRSKRIVGGEPIPISKVPWMAMLTKYENQYCGATIISKTAVLTSARCLSRTTPKDVFVYIGVTTKNEMSLRNRISVKEFILHPKYNMKKKMNDIAIVILEESVNETNYPPIKLPPPKKQNYSNACVAGWGDLSSFGPSSNELREVCFTYNDFKDCSDHSLKMADTETQICVGSEGKDRCYLDAGGPLYHDVGGEITEIGVVSYGRNCGKEESVYTRVSEFVEWIRDTIIAH